jgi:hypothetical protein
MLYPLRSFEQSLPSLKKRRVHMDGVAMLENHRKMKEREEQARMMENRLKKLENEEKRAAKQRMLAE